MVTLRVMSRSPVAAASSPAPAIVSLKVPPGRMIVFEPPRALAAWMAERREICPLASLPLLEVHGHRVEGRVDPERGQQHAILQVDQVTGRNRDLSRREIPSRAVEPNIEYLLGESS